MSPGRPRVILDCNVLVQAVLSPDGVGAACIDLAERGRITLLTSRATLTEARGVLNRPEIRSLKPDVTPELVDAFLDALAYRSDFIHDVPPGPGYGRDPADEPYLDLAIAGAADFLVTRDDDLLSLTGAHTIGAKEFRQRHGNRLRILTPAAFLAELAAPGA